MSVCVQGGPGTIDTVLNAAVNGTPCLLVKGSGQAACWMSDAVLLKHSKTSPKVLDAQQEALSRFLVHDLKMKRDKTHSFNYVELVERLRETQKLLENAKAVFDQKQQKSKSWDQFREQICHAWSDDKESEGPALSEAMRIEWLASLFVKKHYMRNLSAQCVTARMKQVFEAANTGMCSVFLLHTTEPDAPNFKESLLECMLNGICDPEHDSTDTFGKKVQYAILWECTHILKDVVKKTSLNKMQKTEVLKSSLIDAIARNNVDAVRALFEDTCVSVDQFDVVLRLRKKHDLLNLKDSQRDDVLLAYLENAGCWQELLLRLKNSPNRCVYCGFAVLSGSTETFKQKQTGTQRDRLDKSTFIRLLFLL